MKPLNSFSFDWPTRRPVGPSAAPQHGTRRFRCERFRWRSFLQSL